MKMNKFLLLLSLISIFGYSQNNFKPCSIILKDGVKKNGLVNYVKTRNTPQEFKFKSSIEAEIEILDSTEVVSVAISDITKFVFRKNIEVSFESKNLSNTNNNNVKFINKFVEVLVDGEYSLCNYSDNQYEKFYYFGSDLKLNSLKTKMFYGKDEKLMVAEEYKTVLITNLSNNNLEIINEIKNTRLNSSDLSKLFYIINKKDLSILKAKNNDGFLNINLTPDINFMSFKSSNVDFSKKTLFNIGTELEYVLPYYNNLFSIELIPSISIYKNEGVYFNPIPDYVVETTDSNGTSFIYYYDVNNGKKAFFKSTTFSMPFNLKIYPLNKKVKVYISTTLFNLFSYGKAKINFEYESSFDPNFIPPFYGFFEIGGSYKRFGFSFKKLRKFETQSQYFDGYAFSLKYNLYSSKK